MTDEMKQENQPISPFKAYMRGLTIPGIIILACGGLGALISIWNGHVEPVEIWNSARTGGSIGFLISMLGIFDILGGLVIAGRRFVEGAFLALGYLTVWVIMAAWIGFFDNDRKNPTDTLFGIEILLDDAED